MRWFTTLGSALAIIVATVAFAACDSDSDTNIVPDTATSADSGIVTEPDTATAADTTVLPDPDTITAMDTVPSVDVPETPEYPACFGRTLTVEDHCAALQEGYNTDFMVDGTARSFYLHFPPNVGAGGPWPVVFNWHGFGDSANSMQQLLSGEVGGDYPFILVTPQGRQLFPPDGMEWDILAIDEETNAVARLFDEVLECMNQRFRVDPDRVHTAGFSAGAIACDVLGVIRGHCLASVVGFSGAYFTNPDTHEILENAGSMVSWPDMATANNYPQLMSHGGENDNYNLVITTLHFDQAARNDADFLNARGHDLVFCEHGGGHTIPYHLYAQSPNAIVEFFKAHPRGATSPFLSDGLPESYPNYCEIRPAE